MQHFIFPISDGGNWNLEDGVEANHPNFLRLVSRDVDVRWRISNGFKVITEGDFVWAYLTAPLKQIRSIGVVLADNSGAPREKHYRVPIRWLATATEALEEDPISYSDYGQRVQGAVVRATPSTQQVLESWLSRHKLPL